LQLFEKLKQKADEKDVAQRNKEIEDRLKAQYTKQQQRVSDLVCFNLQPSVANEL
jgi:hypothetical protein